MDINMKIQLQSIFSSESVARSAISAFVAQADPIINEDADIKLALSEAVRNCMLHAYPTKVGIIYITATLKDRELTITVRDRGTGMKDVKSAMRPLFTTGSNDHSGMGFTIMESFMDELKVKSTIGKGTTVTMKKHIHGKR